MSAETFITNHTPLTPKSPLYQDPSATCAPCLMSHASDSSASRQVETQTVSPRNPSCIAPAGDTTRQLCVECC